MYKVFVSMRFKGRTEEEVMDILGSIRTLMNAEVVYNYDYEAPENGYKKLHELAHALSLMAECDALVYVNDGKEMPFGCKVERLTWDHYGDFNKFYTYWPEKNSITLD